MRLEVGGKYKTRDGRGEVEIVARLAEPLAGGEEYVGVRRFDADTHRTETYYADGSWMRGIESSGPDLVETIVRPAPPMSPLTPEAMERLRDFAEQPNDGSKDRFIVSLPEARALVSLFDRLVDTADHAIKVFRSIQPSPVETAIAKTNGHTPPDLNQNSAQAIKANSPRDWTPPSTNPNSWWKAGQEPHNLAQGPEGTPSHSQPTNRDWIAPHTQDLVTPNSDPKRTTPVKELHPDQYPSWWTTGQTTQERGETPNPQEIQQRAGETPNKGTVEAIEARPGNTAERGEGRGDPSTPSIPGHVKLPGPLYQFFNELVRREIDVRTIPEAGIGATLSACSISVGRLRELVKAIRSMGYGRGV